MSAPGHGRHRRAGGAAGALVLATVLLGGGCSFGSSSSSPTTVSTAPGPSTTAPPPTTTTTLPVVTVPGSPRTTTTIPAGISGGTAQISGTVVGPSGPVEGATVKVDRAVGGTVSSMTLTTSAAGTFSLPGVQGGRYQVRAWKPPDLAQLAAESFFLTASETKAVPLRVERFGPLNVRVDADADPLPGGAPVNVTVLVYAASISPAGDVVASPIPGVQVIVTGGERLTIVGSERAVAGASGEATFRVQCRSAGATTGEVFVAGGRFPLGLPPCAGGPPG